MTITNCLSACPALDGAPDGASDGTEKGDRPTIFSFVFFLLSYISFSYNFLSLLPYMTALPNLPEKVIEFQFS
jgi:hypothetical protein